MKYDFIKGSSSLLFIIPIIKIFLLSDCFYDNIQHKLANTLLVVTSYLYNSSMNQSLIQYDYFVEMWSR